MKEERTFKIVSDFTGDIMYCLNEVRTLPLAKAYLNEKFEEELRDLVEMYGADDPVCRDLSKLMYLGSILASTMVLTLQPSHRASSPGRYSTQFPSPSLVIG